MRTAVRVAILALILASLVAGPAAQAPRLSVLNASPNGEVEALADANEIRVTFSEPMIALGAPSAPSSVPWFSMTPAAKGAFYWSGTRTLIFTPDPSARLPYATRFTVRIDASVRAVSGRTLTAPFEFTFTTPTVRLLSAEWYRKTGRAADPMVVALRFNQPVRPQDVLANTMLQGSPHAWTPPRTLGDQRRQLEQLEAAGLARLNAKVARTEAAASSREVFPARLASEWNEQRFPRSDALVVLETTTPPAPDTWIAVVVGPAMPSPEGPERHGAQSSMLRLEQTFFIESHGCSQAVCNPASNHTISFRRGVEFDVASRALSVRDVTADRTGTAVVRKPVPDPGPMRSYRPQDGYTYVNPLEIGYGPQPPVTTWRYALSDTLQATDGQTLDYPWFGVVQNAHETPFAYFTGNVWEADLTGRNRHAPFVARNVEQVARWVSPATARDIMPRLLEIRNYQRNWAGLPAPISQALRIEPDAVQAHAADLSSVLSPRATGLAWVGVRPAEILSGAYQASNPIATNGTLLQVTNLGVSVKDSPQATLVFVTRLDNAAPVEGAAVAIVDTTNRERWRGTTDRDGIALAPAMTLRAANNIWQLAYVVTAEKDGDLAYVASDANGDMNPLAFGQPYDLNEASDVLRASIFTDRGVYRLGEELHAKAILRADTPGGMRMLPEGTRVQLLVQDSRRRDVDRRTVTVNRWSSIEWTWRVPDDGGLGNYTIFAGLDGDTGDLQNRPRHRRVTGSFLVAAFRRPDFRVDATLSTGTPILGARLKGVVTAKYLFGGPIAKQPVRWWVTRSPVIDIPAAIRERFPERQFAFGYLPRPDPNVPPGPAQRPTEKTEPLGIDGSLTIEHATERGADAAQRFVFEGDVEGVSGQHIANRAQTTVHPASIYVGLERPPMFFDTRKGGAIRVIAVDHAGTARAGVPVTVSILREQWVETNRFSSMAPGTWERREVPIGEWTVQTTAAGASLPIPLKEGGCYILRGVARDEEGRPTRTEVTFYAIGPGRSFWRSIGNRVDLTPERQTWSPGETARILVQTPWPRATALVTVEREGIRSHRRLEITSDQNTIDVPVTAADVPNMYVSVLLVKGRTSTDLGPDQSDPDRPQFRVGYTGLTVADASKRLKVDVTADREEYRPRQEVRVAVTVAPQAPASGGAEPASREVTLWAMDYGLLSLTGYQTPDVARAIYARKALQVMTADNRANLITRRMLATPPPQAFALGAGGGGRGGGVAGGIPAPPPAPSPEPAFRQAIDFMAPLSESITVGAENQGDEPMATRTDFRPLVFWLGSVATDASGRASTTVTLPDSLTTYRIMAVAGDPASHFGAGESEIRTSKPVTMLPAFPRFLVTGDRASFGAVVTNNTTAGGDAVVTMRSLDGGALQFDGTLSRTVRLAPGESAPIRFDAVARTAGNVRLQMTIALGGNTDAFELGLPVFVPSTLETVAAYGDTTSSVTEKLSIPAGIVPRAGGLTVSLASTALVGLDGSARYLDEYRFRCGEQVASRALALLLSSDLGGAFGLAGAKPDEQRDTALGLLNDLYSYQCGDGGFSFWPGECRATSAYLTAYILSVFRTASTLKVTLDRNAVDRALSYLQNHLREPPPELHWRPAWSASQAFAVKVLAEFGRNVSGDIGRLYAMVESMPTFALSYLADAMAASQDRSSRYDDVVRRISNKLAIDADRAHVEEIDDVSLSWLWNTNVRATAVVLSGISRRGDDRTFVAPMARWLLAARQDGRWGTTQENAVALEALVSYYRAFEAEVPQMQATVSLAGRGLGNATFAGRSTTAQEFRVAMPDLVQQVAAAATRDLIVAREGTGRLYYTARMQYLVPESPDAVDRGIRLERRYERFNPDGPGEVATSFTNGDLVRVTVSVTLPHEGRFLAVTDPVAAGFEPIDGTLKTTATDLGRVATTQTAGRDWRAWMRGGGFDHVEKHDDRVIAFATRLAAGRHEFSYLVRATTAGSFGVAGVRAEAMYAPEIGGRSRAGRVEVRER